MTNLPVCHIRRLGRVPYAQARALQAELAEARAANRIPDTLLLLEHPPTYTIGRRGTAGALLWDEATRAAHGIAVYESDRGGEVTYHGPGQLVGYPILQLGAPVDEAGRVPQTDYVGYVRQLEAMLIAVCARLGVVAGQVAGLTGVWIHPDLASRCAFCPPSARLHPSKIAAIGVKVTARGITQHGFALNVAPNLDHFAGIVACGLPNHPAIGLADLLAQPPDMDTVMAVVAEQFGKTFGRHMLAWPDNKETPQP